MSALPRALCGGEVDAAIIVVAHPNLTLDDVMTSCAATLVPIEGPGINRLVAENPYYFAFEIPAGTYPGQAVSVPTFALAATLVTSLRTSPAVVHEVTKAVFENFDAFRGFHPALTGIEKSKMVTEGLTAPLHEGALRYFEEAGLVTGGGGVAQ